MKFSICIPNYNYESYLGRTIQSILAQEDGDLEIVVSDNASTDRSVAVVREFNDPRVRVRVNACNVGFAGNLDRSASMAQGELLIMLSSDDLMRSGALMTYRKLFEQLGPRAKSTIASASFDVIDSKDNLTGATGPDSALWTPADRQPELEAVVGAPVYGIPADELLRRSLRQMKNPFNFAATIYSAELYRRVEGYGGGRLINPDKWFHWRVLGAAEMAFFVDKKLFAYRWHASNQTAQQAAVGAIKYLVDEYSSTLELDESLLKRIGLSREDVVAAFVEFDIARHGLATLARGERLRARRIRDFGRAAYPKAVSKNRRAWALSALLGLGPIGEAIARRAYRAYQRNNGQAKS